MGRKNKTKSKKRLDKFYYLAKQVGYRSRASFKLIQLDKRYSSFLSRARVAIDLCAAPGSWLQVLSKVMPANSIKIGIDLDQIKPIPGCITFQGDITTQKCYTTIKKELKHFQADVVLNDGAPNVGAQWSKDAYSQTQLVLYAAKLANQFLRKGGTFVTKVFRSRDYTTLISVLKQLFERVDSTKPQASRHSSAEIFVICLNFKAPSSKDVDFQKIFDPKYVFSSSSKYSEEAENFDNDRAKIASLKQFLQRKVNRGGYDDDTKQFIYEKAQGIKSFIESLDAFEFLRKTNSINITDEKSKQIIAWIPPQSIKQIGQDFATYCSDLQVLGKAQLAGMLKWRAKVKWIFAKQARAKKELEKDKANQDDQAEQVDIDQDQQDQAELERIVAYKQQEAKRLQKKKEQRKMKSLIGNKMAVIGSQVTKQANRFTRNAGNEADNFILFDDELRGFIQEKGGIQEIDVQIQGQDSQNIEQEQNQDEDEMLDPYDDDYELKKIELMEKELDEIQSWNKEKNSLLTRKEIKKRAKQERQIKEIIDEGIVLRKQDVQQLQDQDETKAQRQEEDSDDKNCESQGQQDDEEDQELSQNQIEQEEKSQDGSDDDNDDDSDQEQDYYWDQITDDDKVQKKSKHKGQNNQTNADTIQPRQGLLNLTKQWFNQQFFDGQDQDLLLKNQEDYKLQDCRKVDQNLKNKTKIKQNHEDDLKFKGLVKMPEIKSQRQLRKQKLRKQRQRQTKKLQKAQKMLPGTGGTLSQFLQQPETKIQQVPIAKNESIDTVRQSQNLAQQYDSDDIAQTLAIASKMLRKKDRRQIIQSSYNRYCFAADQRKNLPDWFNQDQYKNFKPNLPVTKEEIAAQKLALKQYNARPIKKVAQAKIRKKKRLQKAMQKAKAKAIQISNQSEISEQSKAKQIESIYRKTRARVENKKEKKYSFSKRGGAKSAQKMGQKLKANTVKGKKVKMVDKRMKKDKRAEKVREGKLKKKKRTH